jgi:hypothetical protein
MFQQYCKKEQDGHSQGTLGIGAEWLLSAGSLSSPKTGHFTSGRSEILIGDFFSDRLMKSEDKLFQNTVIQGKARRPAYNIAR